MPEFHHWLAFVLVALGLVLTPGPNMLYLVSRSISQGRKAGLVSLVGVVLGFIVYMLLAAFGITALLMTVPLAYDALRISGALYLLYLAWKIGTSGEVQVRKGERRPMRFHEAIAFQWVNPKAWMMVLTAATTIHLSADFGFNALLMAVLFYVIGLPCICLWAAFGTGLRGFLSNPVRLRTFNIVMALLLVLSMYPVILHMLG